MAFTSEVVHYMLRGGINPILTVLDCSKAFKRCNFSLLFKMLLPRLDQNLSSLANS